MSGGMRFPNDVPPHVRRLAEQASKMTSMDQARQKLMAAKKQVDDAYFLHVDMVTTSRIKSDPVLGSISEIIKSWHDEDARKDGNLMLRAFVALAYDAVRAGGVVASAKAGASNAMGTLFDEYKSWFQRWHPGKGDREILSPEMYPIYASDEAITNYLQAGIERVQARWAKLHEDDRPDFVDVVFNQPVPKGYSRARKELEEWEPAREIATTYNALRRYLTGKSWTNDNIFKGGMSPKIPKDQIIDRWGSTARKSTEYNNMWGNVIRNIYDLQLKLISINKATGLYTLRDRQVIKARAANDKEDFIKAFVDVFAEKAQDIINLSMQDMDEIIAGCIPVDDLKDEKAQDTLVLKWNQLQQTFKGMASLMQKAIKGELDKADYQLIGDKGTYTLVSYNSASKEYTFKRKT